MMASEPGTDHDGGHHGLEPLTADESIQTAVLTSILAEHPVQLTPNDLYRERKDPSDARERDDVDRAIDALVVAGLIHRSGPFVVPSRAAVKFDELHSH